MSAIISKISILGVNDDLTPLVDEVGADYLPSLFGGGYDLGVLAADGSVDRGGGVPAVRRRRETLIHLEKGHQIHVLVVHHGRVHELHRDADRRLLVHDRVAPAAGDV